MRRIKKNDHSEMMLEAKSSAIKMIIKDWIMRLMFRSTPGMNVLATSLIS
ncbi:hypothetical protein SAMN04488029_3168 [Reichenbachiella faecimaris]|uniref:Uncharacterized protein n=1 Tax=Reichenbachiella faecimaris TaxID=692418 RepID=A0A1W2GKU6_REIFA|nr:hypothetical protein SAMN04488029_3168 [Reichenbachiella faecimaris]